MNTDLVDINRLITEANDLSPLPQSTVRLAALVGTKQDNVTEVAEVVIFDPALTFKLIRAANSAFSGGSQPVTTVGEAVARLGTAQVFALAVATSVQPHMQRNIPEYGFSDNEFWRHSVAAAVAAEVAQPFCKTTIPTESFTAALLHDIGKFVIARFLSDDILDLLEQARTSGLSALEAETRVLKVHHGELGGIMAQHWKFPERIVKGIIYHHNPEDGADALCDVVHAANCVAKHMAAALVSKQLDLPLDTAVADRLGVTPDAFQRWCKEGTDRFAQVRTRYNVQ